MNTRRFTLVIVLLMSINTTLIHAETPSSESDLFQLADTIGEKLASTRGLAVREPIAKGLKNRTQLRQSLLEKIAKELPDSEIEAEQAIMIHLGLLAKDQNLKKLVLDILTEQIAGYYDTDSHQLFVIEGMDAETQEVTIAHELFHALQDQHFNLDSIMGPRTGLAGTLHNPDRAAARSALVEGDATLVMIDYTLYAANALTYGSLDSLLDHPQFASALDVQIDMMRQIDDDPDSALGRAPITIQQELHFPYAEGLNFVRVIRTGRKWDALDAVYFDPPDSTEQILHPERYLNRDDPVLIDIDNAPIQAALPKPNTGAWKAFYTSVMGEYRIRTWLETRLNQRGQQTPILAAAGWDGDRIKGFRAGDSTVVVVASVWDSDTDAVEFADALVDIHKGSSESTHQNQGPHGSLWCGHGTDTTVVVERWGTWVVYISGVPHTGQKLDLGALREAVWQGRRAGPYPKTKTAGATTLRPAP